jgi:hypothetical protein
MMVAAVMTDEGLAGLSHDNLLDRLYCFKPKITTLVRGRRAPRE